MPGKRGRGRKVGNNRKSSIIGNQSSSDSSSDYDTENNEIKKFIKNLEHVSNDDSTESSTSSESSTSTEGSTSSESSTSTEGSTSSESSTSTSTDTDTDADTDADTDTDIDADTDANKNVNTDEDKNEDTDEDTEVDTDANGDFSDEENQRKTNQRKTQSKSNNSNSNTAKKKNTNSLQRRGRPRSNITSSTRRTSGRLLGSNLCTESKPKAPLSMRQQIALAMQRSADESSKKTSTLTRAIIGKQLENSSNGSNSNSKKTSSQASSTTLNKRGETKLHSLAVSGDLQGLSFFLDNKTDKSKQPANKPAEVLFPLDVNAHDYCGWTALHESCNNQKKHITRELLDGGANPNLLSDTGRTPLIDAVLNKDFSAVQLLLNRGANPLLKNDIGLNAFYYAPNYKIEKLLSTYFLLNNLEIPPDLTFKFLPKPRKIANNNSTETKKIELEVEHIKKKEEVAEVVGEHSKPTVTSPPQVGSTPATSSAFAPTKTATPGGNESDIVPKQNKVADNKKSVCVAEPKTDTKLIKLVTIKNEKVLKVSKSVFPTLSLTTKPKIVRIKDFSPDISKSDDLKLTLKIPRSNSSDTLPATSSDSPGQHSFPAGNNNITTVLKVKKVKPIGEQILSQSISSAVEVVLDNSLTNTNSAKPCLKSKFKLNSLSNTYQVASDKSLSSSDLKMSTTQSSVIVSQTTSTTSVVTSTSSNTSVITSSATLDNNKSMKEDSADNSINSVTVTHVPTITTITATPAVASGHVSEKVSLVGNNNTKQDNGGLGSNNTEGISKETVNNDNNNETSSNPSLIISAASAAATVGHSLRGRKRRKSAEQVGSSTIHSLGAKKAKEAEGKLTITSTGTTLKLKKPSSEGGGDYEEEENVEEVETEKVMKADVSNEQQQQPLKVPPLRIVLPTSTSTSGAHANNITAPGVTTNPNIVVINQITPVSNTLNTINLGAGASSESTAVTSAASNASGNYPYVMANASGNDDTDGEPSSPSSSATTTATTSNTTTTTRITRSSQRVANQKAHHHGGSDDDTTPSYSTRKKKFRGIIQQQHQSYSRSNSPLTLNVQQQQHDNDDNSSSSTASGPMPPNNGAGNSAAQPSIAGCSTAGGIATTASAEAGGVAASTSNGGTGNNTDPQAASGSSLQQYDPDRNSYRMFESIRSLVLSRRQSMKQVSYEPPRDYSDYLTNNRNYLLHRSPKTMQPKVSQPPSSLKPRTSLYQLFVEQEQERHKLRVQHQVQLDKLRLCYEQDTLRLRTRMAHAAAQQLVPLSVCTYLKDEELYNLVEFANDPTVDNVIISNIREMNSRFQNDGPSGMTNSYGGIKCSAKTKEFLIWKAEIDEKWRKRKEETLARQRMEAEALASKQRLRWIWKQCQSEIGPGPASDEQAHYDALNIDEVFVPTVKVVADFDLLPNGI